MKITSVSDQRDLLQAASRIAAGLVNSQQYEFRSYGQVADDSAMLARLIRDRVAEPEKEEGDAE